ncbi:carboxymuconolactone decarboxylase family protein [Paenibacillus sp. WQ 127069]|uniref:Carboxymuconolactone decarboxylase family protein n=1 Tax=Paenibacillus baimaensis TaxID=2982185 RepID=A0ABT2UIM8_9BACL|nr:carboxymuconolactone decarboxylase family protein [Paenibacillus sp. WQ 127069]MCU6794491.1 carboxymuconolactone decarboxylase family protein [Paenibacillus sp. WQ 127069]
MSISNESLYLRSNYAKYAAKFVPFAPETFKAFSEFNKLALQDGALSGKFKELIAIAVAHATGCPYCIDIHVTTGHKLQLTKEEIFEAIAVSALVKGYSAFYHGVNALNALRDDRDDELYSRSNLTGIEQFEPINEQLYTSVLEFRRNVLAGQVVSSLEKALIAVAIAHITGCAYSIEDFTVLAQQEGAAIEEIAETILVATALKAGSALAHRVNAYSAFIREDENNS